jgi:hypothetical protein
MKTILCQPEDKISALGVLYISPVFRYFLDTRLTQKNQVPYKKLPTFDLESQVTTCHYIENQQR